MQQLLTFEERGIYCPSADIYIDPWSPVERAIITHAHSDHARRGCRHYLAHLHSVPILKLRLGADIQITGLDYNKPVVINGVRFSLHPAGHMIGSAQVRVEYKGEVWVVSGDYKLDSDGLAAPFESVRCHHFVTESTFALPIYRFPTPEYIHEEINEWWRRNKSEKLTSVLIGYSVGKAQRLMKHLDSSIGDIFTHETVANVNNAYRQAGLLWDVPERASAEFDASRHRGSLVIAPPSILASPWLRPFEPYSTGYASGWMLLRSMRRRAGFDRGFVLSDHADWDQLNEAVRSTSAQHVCVMHGYSSAFTRWLRENQSVDAVEVERLRPNRVEHANGMKDVNEEVH